MSFSAQSIALATEVLSTCRREQVRLATAESCTGGLIAACLTEIAGSSTVVDRGWVAYDNRAKQEMLGVPAALLAGVGAVSEEVARALAEGALERAPVTLAVAVTGVAGPGGGTAEKPVGLVHLAVARRGRPTRHRREVFSGDRHAVRAATVDAALRLVLETLAS